MVMPESVRNRRDGTGGILSRTSGLHTPDGEEIPPLLHPLTWPDITQSVNAFTHIPAWRPSASVNWGPTTPRLRRRLRHRKVLYQAHDQSVLGRADRAFKASRAVQPAAHALSSASVTASWTPP